MSRIGTSTFTNRGARFSDAIAQSMSEAESMDISVSFLMESGLELVSAPLADALARGAKVRVLTGTYLGITSPFVLRELLSLPGDIEVRLYSEKGVPFHPKAYIFHYADGSEDELFVGSSNLSRSALTSGVEWNYRLRRSVDCESFDRFQSEFDFLFRERSSPLDDEAVDEYRRTWRNPGLAPAPPPASGMVPRGPQIDALAALRRTRADGMARALEVAATGVGKTFIAAKDSEQFGRTLFVAHRAEILEQAERTFRAVRPGLSTGFMCQGRCDADADILFASIRTLSERISSFEGGEFDYVVVDEFHHAAADGYLKVLDRLRPRFLLGLTATPERLDNRDVFVLCDYNVPYEIGLADAIRFGSLVPFSYRGIADGVDYTKLRFRGGRYDPGDLDAALAEEGRAGRVLDNYLRYPSRRALGFCSSVRHAVFMRDFFRKNGVPSMAVAGDGSADGRREAVSSLERGDTRVVFAVDVFNEGVDIPSVDMVMFLRPTESPTVFMQQLGRGLRTCEGKSRLTVLDFIGNYRNVDRVPSMLAGARAAGPREASAAAPVGCDIEFDLAAIEIMERMARRRENTAALADAEFDRVRAELGRVPTRTELFVMFDPAAYSRARRGGLIFRDYLGYLKRRGLAGPAEASFCGNEAGAFVRFVETTAMSKMYKMPVLLAFFGGGGVRMEAGPAAIARSMRSFYSRDGNRADLDANRSGKRPEDMSDGDWERLAYANPVRFLTRTAGEFFSLDGRVLR